jgi:hypothetical protein
LSLLSLPYRRLYREGNRLYQRLRFLALGYEQLNKMWLKREQFVRDPLDLGRVLFALKQ